MHYIDYTHVCSSCSGNLNYRCVFIMDLQPTVGRMGTLGSNSSTSKYTVVPHITISEGTPLNGAGGGHPVYPTNLYSQHSFMPLVKYITMPYRVQFVGLYK